MRAISGGDMPLTPEEWKLLEENSKRLINEINERTPKEYQIPKPKEGSEIVDSIDFDAKDLDIFNKTKYVDLSEKVSTFPGISGLVSIVTSQLKNIEVVSLEDLRKEKEK